ncbi:protein ANTAGONIST OF LIKE HETEROCHROMATIN PROTEIN 1-like [Arachis hypogaea]|uniref:protein ANTAGONIST OF LIKE HETEROCHROMATIN PROTEIN 1-like n=1 Tax=Arachis hypogaea TaxID=3818 RepID=UPI003B222CFC
MDRSEQIKLCVGYYWIMRIQFDTLMLLFLVTLYMYIRNRRRGHTSIGRRVNTLPLRRDALDNIIGEGGDRNCIWELRMSLNEFSTLCELLQVQGGLDEDGHVGIGEKVATFLIILAHHTKNCNVQVLFYRSGETISRYFYKADPVPQDCVDPRWKWFKGCLGALDGTYLDVTVPKSDKSRYRTRKSRISTNVLGVYNRNMDFVYVLSGWEGSASDSRILRDAITRHNGLKIPVVLGCYYLVDAGYTNGREFLSPYRNVRYHINKWIQGHWAPQNRLELFNKKHFSARNVIEQCFGLLKKRWAIL